MGWTSFRDYNPDQSRADIIRREFTQTATADNPTSWGFEQISTRGAIVYAIMHRDTPGQPRAYFGMIFITQRKNGNFAYKDISEDCGPYYYDAPLNMIDKLDKLAPTASQYAAKWREAVRQHHARKNAETQPMVQAKGLETPLACALADQEEMPSHLRCGGGPAQRKKRALARHRQQHLQGRKPVRTGLSRAVDGNGVARTPLRRRRRKSEPHVRDPDLVGLRPCARRLRTRTGARRSGSWGQGSRRSQR